MLIDIRSRVLLLIMFYIIINMKKRKTKNSIKFAFLLENLFQFDQTEQCLVVY
jgi:hypothetical protein